MRKEEIVVCIITFAGMFFVETKDLEILSYIKKVEICIYNFDFFLFS